MNAIIQVIFVGEEGEDTGGLRREFWRLFALQAVDQYCIGDAHKTFLQNVPALQVSLQLILYIALFSLVLVYLARPSALPLSCRSSTRGGRRSSRSCIISGKCCCNYLPTVRHM